MNLILGIAFFGVAMVGFYTIYLQKQLDKLSKEFDVFKQKVQKGFTDVHKDIDMVDKTMKNSKQQLNG
jgi:polyhydroxyalkanoate synthesis regulator protein|tara:strand:+ start:67 stop:270 length:204 start_codon:yes stop_codon:yes gene_type:complete